MSHSIDIENLNTLKDIIGDDLKAVLINFTEVSPSLFEEMMTALNAEDSTILKLKAHTLKGSASSVGANQLASIAAEIEALSQVQPLNMTELTQKAKQLSDELTNAITDLINYLDTF